MESEAPASVRDARVGVNLRLHPVPDGHLSLPFRSCLIYLGASRIPLLQ